jgi:CubicO group peptidase (beta-lactamase class C family)
MRVILLATVLLAARLPAGRAADDNPKSGVIDQAVGKLVEASRTKHGVPAVAAIVATSKGTLSLRAEGLRKAGDKVKIQPGDKFHLGSNTKAFTALLIAVLVQRKQLSYDLTFDKVFPEFARTMSPSMRKVSLDLLVRHRAGMPDNLPDWWIWARKNTTPRQQRAALIKHILSNNKHTVKPDEAFSYSNLGYVLAAAMIERKLNDSYENLLKKYVLDPLKITSAGFGPVATSKLRVDQPWGHEEDGTPVDPGPNADNPPLMNPSGRLHLTLSDWGKYAADQLKGAKGEKALLPAEVYQKLQEPASKEETYAPGAWIVLRTKKGNLLMHDGSNTFNYASALLDPTRDYAVLVVSNQGKKKGEAACTSVRNAMLEIILAQEAAKEKKEP